MQSNWLRKYTGHKNTKQKRQKQGSKITLVARYSALLRTLNIQFLTIAAILLAELYMRYNSGSDSIIVIALLGATIYTAHTTGVKQGLVSAALVVLYSYVLIMTRTDGPWLSFETLQRGAVIAIAFPFLAFVIGRLKERNDALLTREQTAREKAEASERQLRFMAESMPQKIFTIKPNGDPDYANPQWDEYTGGMAKQGTGNDWTALIHPDDVHENTELWQRSLETGEPFQFEHRLKRNDGKYIWHITRAHALRDETGAIMMWIGSTTDIEDVRKTRKLEANTAKLIKQRAQLMELNAAKDEFISLASHQLRTPATGVKQYVNMVLDGYAGKISPKLRTFLEKANDSNERQICVINDLLRVAQIDAGKVVLRKEEIDASRLVADIIHEQSAKFAARDQVVTFKKPKQKMKIRADATKLRMVIENVIDNASKYTPIGKSITVRLTRSRGMVQIAIKDEGVGIAPDDIKKVFQKFLRLDNAMSMEVGGTGLGLYWAQKVIELHDGSVSVASALDEGSTFTLSLPVA